MFAYNGTEIKKVFYNEVQCKKVFYNGVLVYQSNYIPELPVSSSFVINADSTVSSMSESGNYAIIGDEVWQWTGGNYQKIADFAPTNYFNKSRPDDSGNIWQTETDNTATGLSLWVSNKANSYESALVSEFKAASGWFDAFSISPDCKYFLYGSLEDDDHTGNLTIYLCDNSDGKAVWTTYTVNLPHDKNTEETDVSVFITYGGRWALKQIVKQRHDDRAIIRRHYVTGVANVADINLQLPNIADDGNISSLSVDGIWWGVDSIDSAATANTASLTMFKADAAGTTLKWTNAGSGGAWDNEESSIFFNSDGIHAYGYLGNAGDSAQPNARCGSLFTYDGTNWVKENRFTPWYPCSGQIHSVTLSASGTILIPQGSGLFNAYRV